MLSKTTTAEAYDPQTALAAHTAYRILVMVLRVAVFKALTSRSVERGTVTSPTHAHAHAKALPTHPHTERSLSPTQRCDSQRRFAASCFSNLRERADSQDESESSERRLAVP